MDRSNCRTVVLAAGRSRRMGADRPKVLYEVCGRSLLDWVLEAAQPAGDDRPIIVVGFGAEEVERRFATCGRRFVRQTEQRGTGHALLACREALAGHPGDVLVVYGDSALVTAQAIERLLEHHRATGARMTLSTALLADAGSYGRILRRADGTVARIIEAADCDDEQRRENEVMGGAMVLQARGLFELLERLRPDNAQGEFYLTDLVKFIAAEGGRVEAAVAADAHEVLGVNTFQDLAEIRRILQARIIEEHMRAGVHVLAPEHTVIDADVQIGAGTTVLPFSVIRSGVRIGAACEVGPFAHLRAGTVLADGAEVGNFTETKATHMGAHAKAKHLSYLGDARIGERANIGAGTICCNFDGRAKHETEIGAGAFIGSGTLLVAPVKIGARAVTGAGAVVTARQEVPEGQTVVGVPARPLGVRSPPAAPTAPNETSPGASEGERPRGCEAAGASPVRPKGGACPPEFLMKAKC